jgi:SOS response regulatory protein OraA/RecX
MGIQLRRSHIEEGMFEILDGEAVVQEMLIPFLGKAASFPEEFESLLFLEQWLSESEIKWARQKAVRLLGARNYCGLFLFRKLKEDGYSDSICDLVVEEMKELGYIQDQEFLEHAIAKEFAKGYGPRWIEQKIKSKGLPMQAVRRFITPEMQEKKMQEYLEKQKERNRQKNIRILQQRGFDFDLILRGIEVFDKRECNVSIL